MKRFIASLILFCATFVVPHLSAFAGPITVPTGLSPGDQYRLAFVTSTSRDATSSNIADYNTFVTTDANSVPALAALGTTWTAIASTNTINAYDNTSTNPSNAAGVPIYDLGSDLVASNNASLWSGKLGTPILLDEVGLSYPNLVWTGTATDGSHVIGQALGSAGQTTWSGLSNKFDARWVSAIIEPQAQEYSLYAISGVLTVPVPEPSTLVLAGLAAAGLAVPMLRRRRHGNSGDR